MPIATSMAAVIARALRGVHPLPGLWMYTPTHYVAPFASVAGASNDYADLGATAWANAADPDEPTTLGTWAARATAGTKTRAEPGIYNGQATGNRWIPSFSPGGDGAATALNPIVLFARYPAAYYYGQSSLYSELRKPGTPGDALCPVLGPSTTSDHVIFDGFYADEDITCAGPNAGIFQIGNGSTGVKYRRCLLKRGNTYTGAGYNANAIYIESAIDPVVEDCRFVDRVTEYTSNKRQTGNIEVYNANNYLLRHNTHDGNFTGQYIKENDAGAPYDTRGRMCYNRFLNVQRGLIQQQGEDNEVDHNLVYLCNAGDAYAAFGLVGGPARPDKVYNIHHNTFVVGGPAHGFDMANSEIITSLFDDNIIYLETGHSGRVILISGPITLWDWADWALDNNCYFSEDASYTFSNLSGGSVSGLTAWRTETSDEANSITSDPQFVDAANGDFRLQGGSPAAGKGCYETGTEEIGMRANPVYE